MGKRVSSPILVGRREALQQLESAFERARRGEPGLVLVAGEAGIGKTRLVSELVARLRGTECQVLAGGCVSLSAEGAPFGPIVEGLRTLTRDLSQADLDAVMGSGAGGLLPLLPHLSTMRDVTGSTGISPDTAEDRLLELLLGVVGRLAARAPVLMVVEDIQWADRSTIDLIAFLARNLRDERVLLVTTFRTDEPQARRHILPLIAELGRGAIAERIDLEPLNRAEVGEQLSAILGAPAASSLVDEVYARCQGNAFFSEELLAADSMAGSMPRTLRDVLSARLGALGHEARELVRVASAAGRRFSEGMLASMTDAEPGSSRSALREAIDHQILVRESGVPHEHLAFRHALLQELLYVDLLPSERVRLHGACARAIEERLAGAPDAVLASELAYHWEAAQEPERALHASIAAGMAADAAGARHEAALQFQRAIALLDGLPGSEAALPLDRVQLLERAAANLQDEPSRAVEHAVAALALVDPEQDPVRAGLLHAALARYLWFSGDGAGALEACREAVRLVPAHPPSVARARVAAGLGQILMILARWEEGVAPCEEAVAMAAATGARSIESHGLNTLGILTAYLGDVDGGLVLLRRALAIAEEIDSIDDLDRAYANVLDVLIFAAARYDEAGDIGLEAIGPAGANRFTGVSASLLHSDVAAALYFAGRWDEACAVLDRARLQPAGGAGGIALEIRAAQLQIGRGELEEAGPRIEELVRVLEEAADPQWIAPTAAAQAELAIWNGDPAEALRAVAEGLRRSEFGSGANVSRIGPLLALGVRAAADLAEHGRRHRSDASLDSAHTQGAEHLARMRAIREEIAMRWQVLQRIADSFSGLCEAEATRLKGRSDPAAWSTGADLLRGLGQPYLHAYARYREGEAFLAAPPRDPPRARAALREAHEVATGLGAAPLQAAIERVAARGRVDLSADGARGRRSSAPAGLTRREQEILGLVADGLTNRQIGERLFITEKTAGHHVSNILAKLRVASRAEAAAAAVRLGIAQP